MNGYTISRLARDAGVSTHVVRDYEMRGLLSPCQYTDSGYRLYDETVLQRLRFILMGKEAGLTLTILERLCRALDSHCPTTLQQEIKQVWDLLEQKEQIKKRFERALKQQAT